jgi:hypothetical protein
MAEQDDRREFQRYPLRAFAELGRSNKTWNAHVLDISAQGARIALLDEYDLQKGVTVRIKIELLNKKNPDGTQAYLHLNGIIAHQQKHILGIFYQPDTECDAQLLKNLLATAEGSTLLKKK